MPKRRWNKTIIIESLRSIPKSDLYSTSVKNNNGALWKAAVRHFGSWGNAVEAAGFDYEEIVRSGPRVAPNKGNGGACKFPGCDNKHHASGLCQIHYNFAKRAGQI